MSSSPPGWHPDPNLPPGTLRWWDGTQWTEHIRSAPPSPLPTQAPQPAASMVAAATAPTTVAAVPQQALAQNGFQQVAGNGFQPVAAQPVGAHEYQQQYAPVAGQPVIPTQQKSVFDRNPTSFGAMAVILVYIFIAATLHFALLGIVPFFMAIRAFRRGEQLAPVAMAAVVFGILVAFAAAAHH